jgi:hypothetical protein
MAERLSRISRALIWLPACLSLVFCFFTPNAFASTNVEPGLSVTVYNNLGYNNAPPMPDISGAPIVGTTTVSQVNQNFDQYPMFGMYEDFIVRYEGYITSPVSGNVLFWPQADDGTKLYINDVLVQDDWVDKGGGGSFSDYVQFEAGVPKKFEMWFYENGGGAWTELYWDIGSGWELVPEISFTRTAVSSVSTTTTTVPKYLGAPTNLVLTDTGYSIIVNWDAAENNTGVSPERYAVSWTTGQLGWGVPTGNAGDSNALNTEVEINYSLFSSTGGIDAEYTIRVRADNDTEAVYSEWSLSVPLKIGTNPTPPTTTTSSTTTTSTTTTTVPETSTSVEEPTTTTVPEEDPLPTPTPLPESEMPQTDPQPSEQPQETQEPVVPTGTTQPEEEVKNSPDNSTAVDETDDSINQQEDVTNTPQEGEEAATEISVENIEEITADEITPEVADELVDVLVGGEATESQIVEAVDALLESESITEELATELATSEEVLQAVTSEQAEEIFDAIDESSLTEEEALAIVEAVQDAPAEVREAFEDTVDLFSGTFDSYQMVGQTISVGERRTIVAVNLITATAAATALAGGMPGPSSGGGNNSGGGSPSGGGPAGGSSGRKPEDGEEEQEMAGEIAGDGFDWVSKISIYKTIDEERVLDWKAFVKKFWLGVLNLGFTIAGSVVVYFTLSGPIQKIALVSTILAFASSMYLHMKEPE